MKGVNDPGEQWMIILGKSVNMTNRPAKQKKSLIDKIKELKLNRKKVSDYVDKGWHYPK